MVGMKTQLLALALLTLSLAQDAAYFQALVPIPAGAGVNQAGYTYLKSSTMMNLFGSPCPLTVDCTGVTNPSLAKRIIRRTIEKYTFSGADIALDALSRAIVKVKAENPALYTYLGNSGMLCCRAIRGSTTTHSNHAWGFAVDFNMAGVLDPRGDAKAQRGLALLWPYMKAQGFYWAAGYSGASEDAMHFEIADELMVNFGQSGDWGTCTSSTGLGGRCLDVGECGTSTESGRCPGPANIKCCISPPAKKFVCVTGATELNLRASPCTTAAILLPIPQGESLEVISNVAPVTACGNTWQKVRARNAWTGYVASSFVTPCSVVVREFADDTDFPEPTEVAITLERPGHDDDTAEIGFEISASTNIVISIVLLFAILLQ
eukprot:TRINITY_DN42_c0_g2_i1.p1 TRINITY_DN42_c0_g2~~TRINITY_DN42_c0_g2_i1.p1  ORF type:complete len:377 (-),score=108.55 TRINITY_DN42_c0_g2_i1:23-1153(-)